MTMQNGRPLILGAVREDRQFREPSKQVCKLLSPSLHDSERTRSTVSLLFSKTMTGMKLD